ncbi:glycosyltransferase [Aquiflexum sp. LQ15W]|uniref:glycosyltransferase family 2 protein n=1 Tax=Cognataquiflexum nitidum TaxID=2922272 RepID=UPI001F137E3E|nr:glycosyltransferase family 2 protein [Cognataquiflexum nitidum]MCH6201341.1 glycosyltransferase [Cognataquiflexum nitidum]
MIEKPLVSVLMTAYNREKYIAEAIESVLRSTYRNFELIIVDDCSLDKTFEIAKAYEEADARIRVYHNTHNLGQFPNRNKAASLAKGMFLMCVDSDDTINIDGIENVLNAMLRFPDCSFGMYWTYTKGEAFALSSREAIHKHFFIQPCLMMGPGGTIIKREYFNAIKGYPYKYGVPGDLFFNLKAASQSPVVMLPFDFMFYRRHEGQEINNQSDYLFYGYTYLRDALQELDLHLSKKQVKWLQNKNKRRFLVNIIKTFAKTGNWNKVKTALRVTNFRIKDAIIAVFQ